MGVAAKRDWFEKFAQDLQCKTWQCKDTSCVVGDFQVKFKSYQCQLELAATLPASESFVQPHL
jgi:hypothetical protein